MGLSLEGAVVFWRLMPPDTVREYCQSSVLSDVRGIPDAIVAFNPALNLLFPKVAQPRGDGLFAKMDAISPVQHLDADPPPMIIFHGEADSTVPYASAVEYAVKAKTLGIDPVPTLIGYTVCQKSVRKK